MFRFVPVLILVVLTLGGTASTQTQAKCAGLASCPNDGCGAKRDPDLNVGKNRTAPPSHFTATSFADFVGFNSKAVNKKIRSSWTDAERARVEAVEGGSGITLTAYLFDATLAEPETCNCFKATAANRDFHIWLAGSQAGAKKKKFVVVEMTPRIRKSHPAWKLTTISKIKPKSGKPWTLVRVRGYALFDNEHWDFPKRKIRATAWEIHPITEFSYCTTGDTCDPSTEQGWKNLDQ
jgi:hypothetical protein